MSDSTYNDASATTTTSAPQSRLSQLGSGNHIKQKRARSQLSCVPCRSGKLKCSRAQDPACDQCIKRGREGQCVYLPPPAKQKPTQNVKGRIRQLENLVVDLMNQQNSRDPQENRDDGKRTNHSDAHSAKAGGNREASIGPWEQPTPPSDNDATSQNEPSVVPSTQNEDMVNSAVKPFGQMRINKDEISYTGDTHWQTILNSISELKRDLDEEADDQHEQIEEQAETEKAATNVWGVPFGAVPGTALPGPKSTQDSVTAGSGLGFMLSTPYAATREQLIAAVPEKKVADRLLSLWFNSPDPLKPILHAPTFQDEYRRFWRAPQDTSTTWLGMLFAIMSLAASFGLRDIDPTSDAAKAIIADVHKYHTLSASAALLADFSKPKQYTVESLLLYAAGLRSDDAFVNVWLIAGLVIRIALRMGYHRDPSNYPAISVFQGEMRRRTWAMITMLDVLLSFQLGLPAMVKTLQSDTQPPRNLLDRDFDVNTKVLPPGRGIDELTPSSYTRAKVRIVRVFADASDTSHTTSPATHETTMELDRRLEEAKADIPPLLRMPDFSELVTDPAEQLMCRFNLDLLYLKTKLVIHRRYMQKPFDELTTEEQRIGVGFSRKACINAALRVLQHHHTIYQASQAGGQLESVKWYMGSISTHDFLLAAMVICLELSQQMSSSYVALNPRGKLCPHRGAMMDALEKSQQIWSEATSKPNHTGDLCQGNNQINKAEHMFDETAKAGRAMSVMLERVKARFPQQASALERVKRGQANPAGSYSGQEREQLAMYPPGVPTPPFGGIVAYTQWGDMTGVPGEMELNLSGPLTTDSSGGMAPSASASDYSGYAPGPSNDTSPAQGQDLFSSAGESDFSMLGDMLDMPGNIDWEMFDTGVTTSAGQQPAGEWESQSAGRQDANMASLGREGPAMFRAGNALMGSGTGPVINGQMVYPGGVMRFPELEDVDYSMTDFEAGPDFNGNGVGVAGGFPLVR